MSYQALARKWRPRSFAELVGQEHVKRILSNALESDRLHHAYLFTGTRGVGKTTIARIFAKSLNCEQGVGADPCNQCSACRAIDEGRFMDLIEVDAASRTGVDDTRELLSNVQYAPTQGRYKIYLIDEVHMFSTSSFNALLKTLEEPPPHVKFLLATTDPQKIPATVLSRCLQCNLKRLPQEQIVGQLRAICQAEEVTASDDALQRVARAAEGSLRDALSLLDQAIAQGAGEVDLALVMEMLGTLPQDQAVGLLEAVHQGDGAALLGVVDELAQLTTDLSQVLEEVILLLHGAAILQTVPGAALATGVDEAAASRLATALSPEDVQLYYQIALTGRRDLPLAPEPRSGLEMVLLRMMAFRPADAAGSAPGGTGGAERTRRGGEAPPGSQVGGGQSVSPSPAMEATPAAATQTGDTPTGQITTGVAEARGEAPPVRAPRDDRVAREWLTRIDQAGLRGMSRQLALNTLPVAGADVGRGKLLLQLPADRRAMATENAKASLAAALTDGAALSGVQIEVVSEPLRTPALLLAEDEKARRDGAEQALRQDPAARALQECFDAELDVNSVVPLDGVIGGSEGQAVAGGGAGRDLETMDGVPDSSTRH